MMRVCGRRNGGNEEGGRKIEREEEEMRRGLGIRRRYREEMRSN